MEAEPRRSATPLEKASLEGTIRMPQVGLGIRLRTAEYALSSEDPQAAIAELIAPIPLDERLAQRTKKANAQHAHHEIGRELTDQEVRKVQAAGNLQALTLIGEALGHYFTSRQLITFDVDGTWSDPELETYVATIQHSLTPERLESVRKAFGIAAGVLTDPEIATQLKERKEAYRGWGAMTSDEKHDARSASTASAGTIHRAVTDTLIAARKKTLSPEEQEIFNRIIFRLVSTNP